MCRIVPVALIHAVTINKDLGRFLSFKKARKHRKHGPYDILIF